MSKNKKKKNEAVEAYEREFEEVTYTCSKTQGDVINLLVSGTNSKDGVYLSGDQCDDLLVMIHDLFRIYNTSSELLKDEKLRDELYHLIAAYESD